METIPVGIRLEVTSWENDGDNYKTKSVNSLTLAQALFYIDFLPLFESHNGRNSNTFGNTMDLTDAQWEPLIELVKELAVKHPEAFAEVRTQYDFDETDQDEYSDFITELAGEMLGYSEFYQFRVFESYKVYDIKVEIPEPPQLKI